MKKLLSILLALTMLLSMIGGAGLSAFASEDPAGPDGTGESAETAGEPAGGEASEPEIETEPTEAPAEEQTVETSEQAPEETGEAPEETEEAPEETPAEEQAGEEASQEEEAAPVALAADGEGSGSSGYSQADGFVAGQTYIIGIEADGKLMAMSNSNGTIVALETDPANPDDSVIWTAASGASGVSLANGGLYLMYGDQVTTRSTAATNWSFSGGTLTYDSRGTKYTVGNLSGDSFICGTSVTAGTIVIYTDGGAGTGGSGTTTDPGDTGDDTADSGFTQTDKVFGTTTCLFVDANGYPLFITDDGIVACDSMALTMTGEAGSYKIDTDKPNVQWTVSEGTPPYLALSMTDKGKTWYLYIDDNGTVCATTEAGSYANWMNDDGKCLKYTASNGTAYYIASMSPTGVTTTANASEALTIYTLSGSSSSTGGGGGGSTVTVNANAPQIVTEPVAVPYVTAGSGYAAPVYSITAVLDENASGGNIAFQWYVDGEAVSEADGGYYKTSQKPGTGNPVTHEFTASMLSGLTEPGVHTVYCEVSCGPDKDTNTSVKVSFIVCAGVMENSFLTFSDVHETFTNVGVAINDSITVHGGMIPALIICTGDWANGHLMDGEAGSDNYNATLDTYITRLIAQVGGIDIVFVSGNHDNGAAAADATIAADLGAAEDYSGIGVIYDSAKADNAGSSAENDGLIVFGINYDQLVTDAGGYSYAKVIPELESFLKNLKANYNGELVVISAHAGLHVLDDWSGNNDYNVDKSDEMVALLNAYAETMDIMFFFGHDHSKGEGELVLKPGDSITSTTSYADKTSKTQTLNFTYGHAGYITNTIGGQERYSLVTWNDDVVTRIMAVANGNKVDELSYSVDRVSDADDGGAIDVPPDKPADKPGSKRSGIPGTGDESNIALWAVVLAVCAAGTAVLLPRKKRG